MQHLSLTLGVSVGSITNADFENLYNKYSLLIGPAYRFNRALKVSMGVSMLRRTSMNPVISEKGVLVGGYISLSVDIDFIQGLKDITSLFYK